MSSSRKKTDVLFRVKIQKIENGKKDTVFDKECKGFEGVVALDGGTCAEVGCGLSAPMVASMIGGSSILKDACKLYSAVEVMKNFGPDPEDELADMIGGDQ